MLSVGNRITWERLDLAYILFWMFVKVEIKFLRKKKRNVAQNIGKVTWKTEIPFFHRTFLYKFFVYKWLPVVTFFFKVTIH